jgi:hypothetical protein
MYQEIEMWKIWIAKQKAIAKKEARSNTTNV